MGLVDKARQEAHYLVLHGRYACPKAWQWPQCFNIAEGESNPALAEVINSRNMTRHKLNCCVGGTSPPTETWGKERGGTPEVINVRVVMNWRRMATDGIKSGEIFSLSPLIHCQGGPYFTREFNSLITTPMCFRTAANEALKLWFKTSVSSQTTVLLHYAI